MLYEVAVPSPLRKLFTYESDQVLTQGLRVRIPFRSREMVGIVWRTTENTPRGLKPILHVYDEKPLLNPRTLHFFEKAAEYYGISLGELLAGALPESLLKGDSLDALAAKHFVSALPALSEAQKNIVDRISASLNFDIHLLHGETGSGKTEVYSYLFDQALVSGGQVLFLVPEISLTPQLEKRLADRLGGEISVYHSQLSEKKRRMAHHSALSGRADIFLGARSALFLPYSNLKLIIVDEEHDGSYKQSERGPYQARDLAILRAKLLDIPVVLGSATPSLESFYRVKKQQSPYYRMPAFYRSPLPNLEIVDLKEAWKSEAKSFISDKLHNAIVNRLEKKEQSLIFLNRRGTSSQRICIACGARDECQNCSTTLTVHEDLRVMVCHWCGFQRRLQDHCKTCQGDKFFKGGIGTKQVEIDLKSRFPDARIARLDRDELTSRKTLPRLIADFSSGQIDILVGTQMISKGIDIPNLSLVGIVLADQGWGVPDFRSMERSLQLMLQLRGRGGRRGQETSLIIQTFQAAHPVFGLLRLEDPMKEFYESELKVREMTFLPPYSRLALWTLSNRSESLAFEEAQVLVGRMQKMAAALNILIVGPTPAPLHRWKNSFRYQILMKDKLKGHLTTLISAVLDDIEKLKLSSKVRIDRDPYQFL